MPLLPDTMILFYAGAAEIWTWARRKDTRNQISKIYMPVIVNRPRLAEYMSGIFNQQFKAVNYLLVANGAGLATTLTLAKDYIGVLKQAGKSESAVAFIEIYAFMFAGGLVFAILGFIMLSMARNSTMHTLLLTSQASLHGKSEKYALWLCAGSTASFLTGILTVAAHVRFIIAA